MRKIPDVMVQGNVVPMGFKDRFFMESEFISGNKANRIQFPRVGAFEVFFDSQVIFSKLANGNWPNPRAIVRKIQEIRVTRKLLRGKSETHKKFRVRFTKKRRFRRIKSTEPALSRPRTTAWSKIHLRRKKSRRPRRRLRLADRRFAPQEPLFVHDIPAFERPTPKKTANPHQRIAIGLTNKRYDYESSVSKLEETLSESDQDMATHEDYGLGKA